MSMLTFAVPQGWDSGAQLLYAYLAYAVLGSPIGGALGAFALTPGGYITKLDAGQVQPDNAITAFKASMGLVPATAAILAILQQEKFAVVPIPPGIG